MKQLTLTKGGTASILEVDGEQVRLSAPSAFPPGSTLSGALPGSARALEVKVRRCRRMDSGDFEIHGRFVNLTREQRDSLKN